MQAMIPAMPAAPDLKADPPKAAAPKSRPDEDKQSFSKQLDRAESRREKAQKSRSEENNGAHHAAEKRTTDAEKHPHRVEEKNNDDRQVGHQAQQHNGVEQRVDMAADQQPGNQTLPLKKQANSNQTLTLENLLQSLTVSKDNNAVVLSDSNPIPSQPVQPDNQVTDQGKEQMLASLLDQVANNGQKNGKTEQQILAGTNDQKLDVTVEQWQARFSYREAKPVTDQNPQKLDIAGLDKGVQVQVTPEVTEQVAPGHGTSVATLEGAHQPRDTNSNYIHSNLPGISTTVKEANDKTGGFQQDGQPLNQNSAESTPQGQSANALPGQDTPLIFSLDQAGAQAGMQSGQQISQAATLRLPSGTEVPHSQIANQVNDHFSVGRNLESGSVVLRLHPAELGELRMEIRVEQDNIKAHITTHNPQVQDILDRNIPRLREVLEQQGMNLEHMQVSVAADQQGSDQLFQEQFDQQQFGGNFRQRSNHIEFAMSEDEAEIPILATDEQQLSVHA
jgi:flagellar hook-length control protein FliK